MNEFKSNPCIEIAHKHCACIEFVLNDRDRRGFHTSQLLHYRLGANDDDGNDAPPEELTIAFATADVTLTGWRLNRITEHLRDGDLLAVRSSPPRYANLEPTALVIANISVEQVGKE